MSTMWLFEGHPDTVLLRVSCFALALLGVVLAVVSWIQSL